MKELFSAFNSEIFRPLMTLFSPGVLACAPWMIALMQRSSSFYSLVNENRTEASLVLTLIAIIVGMLLEDIGSYLESTFFDTALDTHTDGKHMKNWYHYMRIAFEREPVGVRYMRGIVLRMKFELGMAGAALVVIPGIFTTTLSVVSDAAIAGTAMGLSAILFREARRSHAALSKTRCLLLEGLIVLGIERPPATTSAELSN
jgi:hypothetical protein